jgi:hypothetical protein
MDDPVPLWTTLPMDATGDDIRIVDLDVARTQPSRVHAAMRVIHLKLDRAPDPGWVRFFHEERESRIAVRRCGLWIEDRWIAFDCRPEDIETHHLPDILRSLTFANTRHREWVAARRAARASDAALLQTERQTLEALRERLPDVLARHAPGPVAEARMPGDAETSRPPPSEPVRSAGPGDPVEPGVQAERDDTVAARVMLEGLGASLADYRRRLRAAQARAIGDSSVASGRPTEE